MNVRKTRTFSTEKNGRIFRYRFSHSPCPTDRAALALRDSALPQAGLPPARQQILSAIPSRGASLTCDGFTRSSAERASTNPSASNSVFGNLQRRRLDRL